MIGIQQQSPSEERAEKQPATASEKPADATQPRPEKPEPKNIARGIGQAKKGKARYKCALCLFRVGIGIKSVAKQLRISPKKAIVIRNDAGIPPLKWRMQPGCKPRKGERAKMYKEPKRVKPALTEDEKRQRHEEQKRKARERYYAKHEESKRISRENARKRYNKLTPKEKKQHQKKSKDYRNTKRYKLWKKKYYSVPERKMLNSFRSRLCSMMDNKTSATLDIVGCSKEFLRDHIERQFKNGMTWDNYGTYWHVDHILPCASFDASSEEEMRVCFNWQNLRPLGAKKNLSKGCTITNPQQHMALSFEC